ncbi:MAG: hypothetical protein JSW49_00135 [candidate division WOR-3 bacterium]|nr:MAG: hypothetical protein JSW49_00135 [candidate division WOR-3 bacterium]
MKLYVVWVIILSIDMASSAGGGEMRFVVMGARTSDPVEGIFDAVVDEISLLRPDFVINVGNLIEVQGADSSNIHVQWSDVKNTMAILNCAKYFVPGSNDVNDDLTRTIFENETGCKRYYSFDKGNCHIVVLDNSMTAWAPMPEVDTLQYAWLVSDLERNKHAGHIFIFFNTPFYLTALSSGQPSTFVDLCLEYRIRAVFNGGLGSYMYLNEDGIDYIAVGSSGATMRDQDTGKGNFYHYLFVSVKGNEYNVAVIKHGSVFYRNVFTGSDYYSVQQAQQEVVSMTGAMVREGEKNVSSSCRMTVSNASTDSISGPIAWQFDSTRYSIVPAIIPLALAAEESSTCDVKVQIFDGSHLFPLPKCGLEYPYAFDKVCTLNTMLSVKRVKAVELMDEPPEIDGRLADSAWQRLIPIKYLGDDLGMPSSMEDTELYLGHDQTNVYIGVRSRERDPSNIRATVVERDGATYTDDNIWFFFDVNHDERTYYQLIVNPNGVAFDRACSIDEGRINTDVAWNGPWEIEHGREPDSWVLEIKIPKVAFAERNDERWGFNFRRLQTSSASAAYWTLPFGHSPANFGIIEFE